MLILGRSVHESGTSSLIMTRSMATAILKSFMVLEGRGSETGKDRRL